MPILVLDIGGVFYRGWPDAAFWDRWTVRTGLDRATLEDALSRSPEHRAAQVGAMTADEAFAASGARLGLSGALFRQLAEDAYLSEFNERLAQAVRGLRALRVRVMALTNTLSSESQIMARPEFAGVFEGVVSSRDVGFAKPAPGIYLALLERLRAPPGDVVFVDDLPGHVEAARTLGLIGIRFEDTDQALAELGAYFPEIAASSRR
ncbi:MAG: HAD-IA family hydrolase [Phenylobacterium sp.]|uniref:HAD-IA family hydrolase n=1 Tax=Phenylobacterium sp. TaxID=1871053 RepID=UPI001A3CF6D6|nr:HAD-IA family hydrolase [Phenylobacterium sp.]MBL8770808.1 HAD-IA family hydrolase [Phenylobacterium sp.]